MLPLLPLFFIGAHAAFNPCPLSGPAFAPPTHLKDDAVFRIATQNLTDALTEALRTGKTIHGPVVGNATAYSASVFSIDDPELLWEWHHTPDAIKNGSYGVREVDSDSVYRVGSISKLITVYTLLASAGDGYWDRPVTDFVPELRERVENSQNEVDYMQWDQVTLAQLAGHTSGLIRDFAQTRFSLAFLPAAMIEGLGLPALDQDDIPKCLINETDNICTRKIFFENIDLSQPTWATNTQPTYSNSAFQILAYAVESIIGKPFKDILSESLLEPLSIDSIFYSKPEDSVGVIPGDPWQSQWSVDAGELAPAGAFYSSTNSLASLGRSILSSSILSPNTTRAWLKPTSFAASLQSAIGLPWEIYRAPIYGNRVTDIYTKSGGLGSYTANIVLLPDYGVGYTILVAGTGREKPLTSTLADILVPALEEAARVQTEANYGGDYAAAESTGLNSSVTLKTTPGLPGVGIESWISNNTNVLLALQGSRSLPPSVRLYPTNLVHELEDGSVEQAWRAVIENIPDFEDEGPFAACSTWFSVGPQMYGHTALDEVLFTIDVYGKVVSVTPRAWGIELEKKGGY